MTYRRALRITAAVALVALHAICIGAPGVDPANTNIVTAGEFARLPEYCRDTQPYAGRSESNPRQAHWLSLMGDTFWHVHHYCWGMLKAMRSEAPDIEPQVRRGLLDSACNEFNYVFERAPKDFPLLPEMLYRAGTYQESLDRPAIALEYFDRSRAAKRDYWPPYLAIAKLNTKLGRRQAAIDILSVGVQLMPDERQLVDELNRLKSLPEPASRPKRK